MAIGDPGLSAEELSLVSALARLTTDPGAERRAAIMVSVRSAPGPRHEGHLFRRLALAAVPALVILVATSVGAVGASGDALPNSPNYALRSIGEQVRLTVVDPATRAGLRLSFARSRISQAQTALRNGDRSDARGLLHDSQRYLQDTRQDIGNLGPNQQGEVQQQLNQAEAQQHQAEGQLNQQGEQSQSGG